MKNDKRIFLVKEIACAKALWGRQNGLHVALGWSRRHAHGDKLVEESRCLVVSDLLTYAKGLARCAEGRRILIS